MSSTKDTQKLWEIYLKERGKAWLKVASGSMSPMIPIGASILVKKCHLKDIIPSDIIVFKSNGKLIVHRVLQKNKDQILQAGDNFSLPSLIHKRSIIGQVALIRGPKSVIDLQKKKNKFLNAIISGIYILAHKIPNHNYWLLKINNKLLKLLRETRIHRNF
ncbi:MAG: signal peptidase I [Deltaproteobacteria bacterium]|nr:signal peptidase I [Deltaproteobacteria bacterium]